MNAVFIKHFDNRQYLFEVPESIKLKEGDRVMVRNRRGEVDGCLLYTSDAADEL